MINFDIESANQLLINPRLPEFEKQMLQDLQLEFEKQFSTNGHFLIASSGSSRNLNSSVKLVALSRQAVLNSAARFNRHFNAGSNDHWGLLLPKFHVAGIGLLARAYLAGSKVFEMQWEPNKLCSWIRTNQIRMISLVPTQVFDLVTAQMAAPAELLRVFVGAGALNYELREKAVVLGWPLVETYGMTETASMIALKENSEEFKVLPGVEIAAQSDILSIRCDSLFTAAIQKVNSTVVISRVGPEGWHQSEDRVSLTGAGEKLRFKFLGRQTDFVKVLGEGVSLAELRTRLDRLTVLQEMDRTRFELTAIEDSRAGFRIILAVEDSVQLVAAEIMKNEFNRFVRPYEKISECVVVGQIPRTAMGKLKTEELKRIVKTGITEDKMANINKIPWEIGSIFICTKCGAKFNEPNLAEEVKSEIRKKQKADETQGKVRVITSSCLGVCYPEKQTFTFMPVEGKTLVFTTELNKQNVLQEVTALLNAKLKE